MFIDFLIGGISASVAKTSLAPIELYRIQKQNYFLPNASLRKVLKTEGIRGLWKGNGVNCIRAFPQYAINLSLFRELKEQNYLSIENKELLHFSTALLISSSE